LASTATQPTAAPQDRPPQSAGDQRVTAREWFASGARRPYDPIAQTMAQTARGGRSSQQLYVFEKVVAPAPAGTETRG
jgi:hypothetical protein